MTPIQLGLGIVVLDALEAGLALWAVLRALAALVLIAVATDGEGALVACHERLAVRSQPDVIATNLADLHVLQPQRLRLKAKKKGEERKINTGPRPETHAPAIPRQP